MYEGNHIPCKETSNIIGTLNYISLNVHNKIEPSRRDDLESVIYILLYLLDYGEWFKNNNFNSELIIECKKNIVNNNFVPEFLKNMLAYIRNLKFEEEPNYSLLINYLKN